MSKTGVSLEELRKAVDSLRVALQLYRDSLNKDMEIQKAFRDACIQRFEYCIEFSWKISMKVLGSSTLAAKPAIREMARNNLIDNPEKWLSFIDNRNNTSHAYDEDVAKKVFVAIEDFFNEVQILIEKLGKVA